MKFFVVSAVVTCCSFFAWGTSAVAQSPPVTSSVGVSERFSSWLLRQTPPVPYPIGLSWLVPQERASQATLKQQLLQTLSLYPDQQALAAWLAKQAVTGRVVLANVDPRWLEAHPQQDPVLLPDQLIVSPVRPTTVAVLRRDGRLCLVKHTSGVTARGYLEVCGIQEASRVWVAQPDGSTADYGIDSWNAQPQSELAPGAWIWTHEGRVTSGATEVLATRVLSAAFSEGLIRFLASLGPAADDLSSPDSAIFSAKDAPVPSSASLLRPLQLSASDWGEIGLLQTPTARMLSAGNMRLSINKVQPYTRNSVIFQPTDWLEAGFRYTNIANRLYDATGSLQTAQAYKDKSLDFKLKLISESKLLPALALGIRDLGGTGFFSSEYLVANKRMGDLDFSLGLGWGNLGTRADFFRSRVRPSAATASGGEVGAKGFFRGPAALFGGVQYQISPEWTYKLERDGNGYQHEPLDNPQITRSQWNFGANYHYSSAIDVSIGWERGRTLMMGFVFHGDLDGMTTPKIFNSPSPKFQPAPLVANETNTEDFAAILRAQTGWTLLSKQESTNAWLLEVSAGDGAHRAERMDHLNGLVQARAAASVVRWDVQFMERGLAVDAVQVDRAAWVEKQTQYMPLSLKREPMLAYAPRPNNLGNNSPLSLPTTANPRKDNVLPSQRAFKLAAGPNYSQILGGPDAFILYRLGFDASAQYQVNPQTWVDGMLDVRIADNYKGFKYDAPSDLPRVRTYMREYETTSRLTMPLLQATTVSAPAADHFTSLYAGYLESMFAGVGGEWLYRPWRSPLAIGIDVNRVYQRDFAQNLHLRDYKTMTGHATAYWDTGISDVLLKLQVGQYLAGDRGATMDVSRRFQNGVVLGAYATKTNVSAQQFGEGSFDKGIYISLPFDVMLPKYSDSRARVTWQPLTRDGGARLQRKHTLYDLTAGRDPRAFEWAPPQSESTPPPSWPVQTFHTPQALLQETQGEALPRLTRLGNSVLQSATNLTEQLTHSDSAKPWLWGAGWVISSTLLDKRLDVWAQNHPNQNGVAKLGNAMPLLLGLGVLSDMGADGVGWTALKSAGFTLAANAVVRASFGRARPYEERGNQQFDAMRLQGFKSGFASNHVAAAFAIATPLAQTYDMPWLYGMAGVTAIGRIQSRQHWFSDTVAGSVLGYAIGSIMTDEHQQSVTHRQSGRQLLLSPNGVAAKWWWQ
jgi:membrane-associated phospholipid phosphatase